MNLFNLLIFNLFFCCNIIYLLKMDNKTLSIFCCNIIYLFIKYSVDSVFNSGSIAVPIELYVGHQEILSMSAVQVEC